MIEEIRFEIKREHRIYNFTIESDEQFVCLDQTLRHPDFLPQNPMQHMNLMISRQEFFEDLNAFLRKVVLSVQKVETGFLQRILVDICRDHISKFGRLWYNDLLMYADLYITIDKAIFKRQIQQYHNLYRVGVYRVLNEFPKNVLFPSPMGGSYSWDDV